VFNYFFFLRESYRLWGNVEKYFRGGQATWRCIGAHVLYMLGKYCYRHTLIISNTYFFSTATVVTWTRLDGTVVRTFPFLLKLLIFSAYTSTFSFCYVTEDSDTFIFRVRQSFDVSEERDFFRVKVLTFRLPLVPLSSASRWTLTFRRIVVPLSSGSSNVLTFRRIVISSGSKYWRSDVLLCLYLRRHAKPWRFGGSCCLYLQGQATSWRFGGSCLLQGQSIDVPTSSCAFIFGVTESLDVSEDRGAIIFRVKLRLDVSEDRSTFMFRVKQSKTILLDPEDEGTTNLRNVGNYSLIYTVSQSIRPDSSAPSLREVLIPQFWCRHENVTCIWGMWSYRRKK
jgi:hypothetical protein